MGNGLLEMNYCHTSAPMGSAAEDLSRHSLKTCYIVRRGLCIDLLIATI